MAHNPKLEMLKEIHKREEALYAERNEKYGDSFSKTYQKRGPAVVLIRLEDKLSRVDHLLTNGLSGSDGESVIDTLMDLSNYANMAIMEIQAETTQDTPPVEEKPKKKTKKKPKKEKVEETLPETPTGSEEEGPLAGLTRKQLVEILKELGGQPAKKATRENLLSQINEYPMPKVAVAITSLNTPEPETNPDEKE